MMATASAAPGNRELCGFTVGGWLIVRILEGSIADEWVDIIVNTTRPDLNLSAGAVARAILAAAGPGIQDELNRAAPLARGDIHPTYAGTLPSNYIIHAVVQRWDGHGGRSQECLRQVMRRCLKLAHDYFCESIAFPALGAGGLRTPQNVCARIMHEEVVLFADRHGSSSLKNIHFVLHPMDYSLVQEFKEMQRGLVSGRIKIAGTTAQVTGTASIPAIPVPSHWGTLGENGRLPNLVRLQPGYECYTAIETNLRSCNVTNFIISISRLENRPLHDEYSVRKDGLQTNCSEAEVERVLFHGAKADDTEDININGLRRSRSENKDAPFGNGVYFSVNPARSALPQYSPPDGNRIKYIYQCRVLTGAFCKGERGLKAPPQIPSLPDGVRYDSVVDDKDNPAIFVIFRDSQAYPEYLIQLRDRPTYG